METYSIISLVFIVVISLLIVMLFLYFTMRNDFK